MQDTNSFLAIYTKKKTDVHTFKILKRFLTLCSKKIPVNLHQFCCLQAVVTFSGVHGVKNQTKIICDYILVKD